MKKNVLSVTLVLLLGTMVSLAQNGTKLIGYDATTIGRAGTSTGFFDNPTLMLNNPAGLAFMPSSQADLSISLMAPTVYYKNAINNTEGKKNLFPMGCLDYVHRGNKLSWGLGVFTQGGMGADFNLYHELYQAAPGVYLKQPYHSKFAVMQAGGSVAYKVTPKFSVGITADAVYSQMEFQMPMSMSPAMLKGVVDPSTGMTFGDMFSASPNDGGLGYAEVVGSADMRNLTAFGVDGKIGVAYKHNEKWSFGISYGLPVKLAFKNGKADMDMSFQMNDAFGKVVYGILMQNPGMSTDDAQIAAMTMFTNMGIDMTKGVSDKYNAAVDFGLPQSISAGFSYAPDKKIRLAVDLEWVNWKNAFDQMDISLTGGLNPNINRMLGTAGIIKMAFPLNWKNSVVVKAGGEYELTSKTKLRAGYAFGSNPVVAETIFPVFPAIVQHHLTAGASYKFAKSFVVNAAYEYAIHNTQRAAYKSYVGNEFNNSWSGLKNSIFHVSVSWLLK